MTNFAPIAWLDPFDLAASLRTRMGLFKPRNDFQVAWIRATQPSDPASFGWAKAAGVGSGKWPEMKIVLDRIKAMGEQHGGIELGHIALVMLQPGGALGWGSGWGLPGDPAFDLGGLLLRGNPGLVFYGGAETWMPTIGVLTLVNRRVPNSAVNMGESPAIWLAVDFRRIAAGEPQEEKL